MIRNCPCPFLPEVVEMLGPHVTRQHAEKGAAFYQDALRYSQSLWIAGKPAQAMLQLNKAWMADLADGEVFGEFPPPYRALVWMMFHASTGNCGYLGNPVRHFQHLASRMSGPRAEVRSWRAWVCFHLAERVLNHAGFPRDGEQIAREGLWIPGFQRALSEIRRSGWKGEFLCAEVAFTFHSNHRRVPWPGRPG